MATKILVNNGSDSGLLPDGTKSSPESMLTYHQWGHVTFIWGQFHKSCHSHQQMNLAWKIFLSNFNQISRDQWVKYLGFHWWNYIELYRSRPLMYPHSHSDAATQDGSRTFHSSRNSLHILNSLYILSVCLQTTHNRINLVLMQMFSVLIYSIPRALFCVVIYS